MPDNQQPSDTQASIGGSQVPYHVHNGADAPFVPLANVTGHFPMVTTTPTFTPSSGAQNILAMNSIAGQIYYYDFTNHEWRSTPGAPNFFGNGSDGAVVLDGSNSYSFLTLSGGNYTCNRDVFLTNCTINTGVTLFNGGYYIFINGTLTRNGTGVIDNSGGAGGDGGNGQGPTGGTNQGIAGTAGTGAKGVTLHSSPAGVAGGHGGDGDTGSGGGVNAAVGSNGTSVNNVLVDTGQSGGAGGAGGVASHVGTNPASGGSGGGGSNAISTPNDVVSLRTMSIWDTGTNKQYAANGGSAGGGGGGGGGGNAGAQGGGGGGGGGSGGPGGLLIVFVRSIVANNTNVLFQANGGKGGNGGMGGTSNTNPSFPSAAGGGGGGGGGGSGGVVGLVYSSCDQTVSSLVSVAGGAKGTGGARGVLNEAGPTQASAGSDGNVGITGLSIIITATV